jgi:alkanesulfonate monooxygenase SsuD/methylene tetrahydromethanopterin reductase-like flavin-dependent oxidoreductase (luciferase family)
LGTKSYKYGLLLPHFGVHASRENLIKGSVLAEKLGFDSVWVRDHLIFHPHGMEGQDRTHVEPFTVLAAVGAVTDKLVLGTGSLIPYRHPIHSALALSSLERVAGPGRVIAGWGIGASDHEFDAIGQGGLKRGEMLIEQYDIMRKLWAGEEISYEGKFYSFNDVDIHPSPAGGSIPIWWCGDTPLSVRYAAEMCDGWMPGRITLRTFEKRMERLTELSELNSRPRPTAAAIPITSPGKTREAGLASVNWRGILEDAKKTKWELPESGAWEKAEDLEGAVIAGTADDIAEVTWKYHDLGLEHLVYDLRFRFEDWMECVQMLGEEVLPLVRSGRS